MNICVLDGATMNPGDNPWTPIEPLGRVTVFDSTRSVDVADRAGDAGVIVTNKVPLDREMIGRLPNLKMIAVSATGYNVVDVAAAADRGIVVSNVPVYSTHSVAQHVFAMLLSFIHRPQQHFDAIREGQWQRRGQFSFWLNPVTELSGKTFGVVGFGRIGQATAAIAKAFGMKIVINSRTPKEVPGFECAQWMSIDQVFKNADVISLHCPQTDRNTGFVCQNLLALMKAHSILINTSRGGLINENDLADALNAGQLGGACLDVLSSEPPQENNPLIAASNCLLTPHIAWTALEARERLMRTTAENIAAFIAGSPINLV